MATRVMIQVPFSYTVGCLQNQSNIIQITNHGLMFTVRTLVNFSFLATFYFLHQSPEYTPSILPLCPHDGDKTESRWI